MIIDSHAYCFEPADSPAGHASREEHLCWLQRAHANHHQPAWRVRDRAPASSQALAAPGPFDPSCAPDVNFRTDRKRGRFVWTVDGDDYTKQFYPPNLQDLAFTPHSLIAEMDYAGVDVALLHTDPMVGRGSAFQTRCVGAYPDRLRSMAPVDEWRIPGDTDAIIEETTTAINAHGLHAIKFIPPLAYLGTRKPWDDGPFRAFWESVVSLNVPIFFTLGTGPPELGPRAPRAEHRDGYLAELRILIRWMERYPQATCSLTHGFPWRLFVEQDRIVLPDAIWEPFDNPNCHLEVCFPVRLGDLFDFPYRQVWPTLETMVERIGADRLLWGTDMPFQNRFCTYRQSRDWIEKYCTFLTPQDLAHIIGATAGRLLDTPPGNPV